MALNESTLAEAINVVASDGNYDLVRDRDELVKTVNRIRELLYNDYADGFKLFDDYKVCTCIQEFTTGCEGECMTVTSVTIPDDMDGVVSGWAMHLPLTLKSRWRESHVGLLQGAGADLTLTALPETSATEVDLTTSGRLSVFTEREEDCNKIVTIVGRDCHNNPLRSEVKLESDGVVHTTAEFRHIDSVVLPPLVGTLKLSQGETFLSLYYPHEKIPRYRRYRVSAGKAGDSVLIQGTRKYKPIHLDSDIVELGGHHLALEHGARYFQYVKGSLESEEVKKAEYELGKFKEQINGAIARKRGRSYEDGQPRAKGRHKFSSRRKTLPGYRR